MTPDPKIKPVRRQIALWMLENTPRSIRDWRLIDSGVEATCNNISVTAWLDSGYSGYLDNFNEILPSSPPLGLFK